MADSHITKRALAASLRQLMEEMPFDRIQIAHICAGCDMSRKSFYYHFKDKYDLLNWIFDTETAAFSWSVVGAQTFEQQVTEVRKSCVYFYENRRFYRRALQVVGQNSFSEHFREHILALLTDRANQHLPGEKLDDFELQFFADAALCAVERWLCQKDCMPPDEFVDRLLHLVQRSAAALHRELNGSA